MEGGNTVTMQKDFKKANLTGEEEREKEIQARVKFKLNQFKDWLKNSANWENRNALTPDISSQKISEFWESSQIKKQILAALQKEIDMTTPGSYMHLEERMELKNDVIEKIINGYTEKIGGQKGGLCGNQNRDFLRIVIQQVERMV